MLQNNDVSARNADRAMLQAATDAFLAQGNAIVELDGFQPALPFKAKEAYRAFSVAKGKPAPKGKRDASLRTEKSMLDAQQGRERAYRARRDSLAGTVRRHAESGISIHEASKAMGVTRNYIRKIAQENKIQFKVHTH